MLRKALEVAFDVPFEDIKRPRMIYDGWLNSDGTVLPDTRLSDTTILYHRERIRIANNVFVWHNTILDGTSGIEIGEGTQIGANVGIFTHSSHIAIRLYGRHYGEVPEELKQSYEAKPVHIGRFVFIATGSTILPGVSIGDGAVIGAGALVSFNVPPFGVVTGNPGSIAGDARSLDKAALRKIKNQTIDGWYREWQDQFDPIQ